MHYQNIAFIKMSLKMFYIKSFYKKVENKWNCLNLKRLFTTILLIIICKKLIDFYYIKMIFLKLFMIEKGI